MIAWGDLISLDPAQKAEKAAFCLREYADKIGRLRETPQKAFTELFPEASKNQVVGLVQLLKTRGLLSSNGGRGADAWRLSQAASEPTATDTIPMRSHEEAARHLEETSAVDEELAREISSRARVKRAAAHVLTTLNDPREIKMLMDMLNELVSRS